jgi:hypothetical protein
MKKGLAILFFACFAGICPAQDALPSWNADNQKAWWEQNPSPAQWPQAVSHLMDELKADYQQNDVNTFSNSDFQGWLEHLEWIQLGLANPDVLADPGNLKTFVALGKDGTVSHLFVEKLSLRDVRKEALKNILRLGRANFDDLHEYAALGVAYSLVFDQPFPPYWPHPQVKQEAVPIGDLDIVQRFNFYVQSNRDKKTDLDLTTLSFENLRFLVDSKVKLSELEYAQQNRISYSHFEDVFSSINYDLTRASGGTFSFIWGQPTYTLQDIEKTGGICVDQAYYATMIGKGRGIPTLYFSGQGVDGGHAWFGYLSRSGKWELDCGRYANQNFARGYALDPQTWQFIDDTELANFFKNGDTSPNYQPARNAMAWALLQGRSPSFKKILDDARSIMPELAETWKLEASFMEYANATDDDKKAFYQSWITQFSSFPDMKVLGQRLLLGVLKKDNDPEADGLQQDIVLANRGSGFDVGIDEASGVIMDKIAAGDWDAARLEYERTIRDFGEQGGGTLFYDVITPYVKVCLKEGHPDQASEAIKFAEDRMNIDTDSVIADGISKLKKEVDDQKKEASAAQPAPSP